MNTSAPISELQTPSPAQTSELQTPYPAQTSELQTPSPASIPESPAPRRSRKKFTDDELLQHLKDRKRRWYLANREKHISRVSEHYYANHDAQLERMRIARHAKRDKLAELEAEIIQLKSVITTAIESLVVE